MKKYVGRGKGYLSLIQELRKSETHQATYTYVDVENSAEHSYWFVVDDKQKAVYQTIVNFPTEEEARDNTGTIASSLLLGKKQVTMFIT
jgi:hypothetical protein